MNYNLLDKKLALLGGDDREIELISILLDLGASLTVVGQPGMINHNRLNLVNSLEEIDHNLEAVIAPMTGTDNNYKIKKGFTQKDLILTEEFFAQLNPGTKFFIGFAKPAIKEWCKEYEIDLIELARLDEVAILNAVPTAEGAVEIAIRESSYTLHNNNSFVLGLGRVGLTLARMLAGLGSNTYGVARKPKDLARASEMGLIPVSFSNLKERISDAKFIFNTAPAPVLNKEILEQVSKDVVIIDLASAPGGTDFKMAKELDIKAQLALGVPGKVASKSAGQILGNIIPRIILT